MPRYRNGSEQSNTTPCCGHTSLQCRFNNSAPHSGQPLAVIDARRPSRHRSTATRRHCAYSRGTSLAHSQALSVGHVRGAAARDSAPIVLTERRSRYSQPFLVPLYVIVRFERLGQTRAACRPDKPEVAVGRFPTNDALRHVLTKRQHCETSTHRRPPVVLRH